MSERSPAGETVSLVVTTYNEAGSIEGWLDSVAAQTRPPEEIVVVDGGSTDATVELLRQREDGLPLRLEVAPGANISRGRNLAIGAASGSVIAITDAGTVLEPTWLEQLVAPLEADPSTAVSSGYFRPAGADSFQRLLAAVITPRLPEVDPDDFLPSSRSVAVRREWWERAGGYPEWLATCEDLVFDFSLREAGARFVFAPEAIVEWYPPATPAGFFRQYRGYARGDGHAGLWPQRHAVRYGAYAAGAMLLAAGRRRRWARAALALGVGAHMSKFSRRVQAEQPWGGGAGMLAAQAAVPAVVVLGDVAKMIGYVEGRLLRRSAGQG